MEVWVWSACLREVAAPGYVGASPGWSDFCSPSWACGVGARTGLEGGTLSPAGVLAAHKIMASSPDMDLATVSSLRVGAGWQGGCACRVCLGVRLRQPGPWRARSPVCSSGHGETAPHPSERRGSGLKRLTDSVQLLGWDLGNGHVRLVGSGCWSGMGCWGARQMEPQCGARRDTSGADRASVCHNGQNWGSRNKTQASCRRPA